VFTTVGGRKVYGNGGIMPDVFVAADTTETSGYLSELYFSGVLNQFAFDIADHDRKRLEAYGGPAAFEQKYTVGADLVDRLGRYAQEQGITAEPADLERSRAAIAMRLKAGIARNIWGSDGFYRIMLDSDSAFRKAQEVVGKH
jgi:carboxyl-terminal processing protease